MLRSDRESFIQRLRRSCDRPVQPRVRQSNNSEGRDTEPSACVTDAQSVKTSTSVHAASQGIDADKKIVGRKRSIITDTLGLLLAVLVTAASVQDSAAGQRLLNQTADAEDGLLEWGREEARAGLLRQVAGLSPREGPTCGRGLARVLLQRGSIMSRDGRLFTGGIPPARGDEISPGGKAINHHNPRSGQTGDRT